MSLTTQGRGDIKRIDLLTVSSWYYPFVSLMFVIRGQKKFPTFRTPGGETPRAWFCEDHLLASCLHSQFASLGLFPQL